MPKRTDRLNSLLKQVLSEVIHKEVKNPNVGSFPTITSVQISKDLHQAKVYVSMLGTREEKAIALHALQKAAGFIGVQSAKKVVMRYFPTLTFFLDESVDKYLKMDKLLKTIALERDSRKQ